jgi:MYXO-CTERM domain-containing protein
MKIVRSSLSGLLVWAALSSSAQAHIKLLKPDAWLNEDDLGAPQKGGPCGPGAADDVQPIPHSMKVTEVKAGDTLMVEFEETIHHPGWFRIALAPDPSEFEEVMFPNTTDCNYDMSKVPTEPHGNVLVDGLGMDTNITGPNRTFMEMVKLPDTPCEKCTLQVIQVMADALHAPPGCVYYHCAELKILPKDGAAAGSGGPVTGTGGAAAGVDSAAGAAASAGAASTAGAGAATGGVGGSSVSVPGGSAGKPATAGGSAGTPATTPTTPGSTGAAGTTPTTPTTGMTGMQSSGNTAAPASESGGCAVATPGAGSQRALGALGLLLGMLFIARRKRR